MKVVAPVPPLATVRVPVVPPSIGKPVALVKVRVEGVPRLGVTRIGEVARTTSPVPVQVNKEEVAIEVASAVEPVMLPSTLLAETWVRLEKGKSPVTSDARSISPLVISCPEMVM